MHALSGKTGRLQSRKTLTQRDRKKETPRKKPHQGQNKKCRSRHGHIVLDEGPAGEKAQKLVVHEVEVEKITIAPSGQEMPRKNEHHKKEQSDRRVNILPETD